jgi:hypothetical protein
MKLVTDNLGKFNCGIKWILVFCISTLISQPDTPMEGYTLFSPGGPTQNPGDPFYTYLLNTEGETVHVWENECGPASMPYLFPDSSILRPCRVSEPTMINGGVGGRVQHITWDGTVLWDFVFSNETYQHHHDIQPLSNGNVLLIAWERKTAEEAYALGRVEINNPLNEFWADAIFEIQPEGLNGGIVVWEWHVWDHLIQDVDPELPGYGVVAEHPELININYATVGTSGGGGGGGQPHADWLHLNAVDYNEVLDQIIFSSPRMNEFYIIDHSTTSEEAASHVGGNSGKGGDFLYRWGNPRVYNRGTQADQKIFVIHGVNWIREGFPGYGNIIYYVNGNNRPEGQYSTVEELVSPLNGDGIYNLGPDQAYGPESPVWVFDDNQGFHSQMQSGAFRQQNGNTLVSVAQHRRIFEVTMDENIVWDYSFPATEGIIARAQKYGVDYLSETMSLIIPYIEGWNLVGLPLTVSDPSQEAVFPGSVEGTLYSFEGGYSLAEDLTPGFGYWLMFGEDMNFQITGNAINSIEIQLFEGWNLITGISTPVQVENIIDPENLIVSGTVYGFNESYEQVEILNPGKGIWVKSGGDGVIFIE